MNLALQAAADMAQGPPQPPLTPQQKAQWNSFLDYLEKIGYKGSPLLDNKNTALGAKLLDQYRGINPDFNLTYDNVKDVQQELQDYRNTLVNQFKQGKAVVDGVKSADEIMAGLSPVDGWLGSKTSSWRFPVATLTSTTPNGTTKKDFGTDLAAYDAAMYRPNK